MHMELICLTGNYKNSSVYVMPTDRGPVRQNKYSYSYRQSNTKTVECRATPKPDSLIRHHKKKPSARWH
jgi:hypothetical protein